MRARLAPLLALLFFTAACALVIADPYAPGAAKYAIVALALSNAAILWAYFGIAALPAPPPRRHHHPGRHTPIKDER